MRIDIDSQARVENHFDRSVKISEIFCHAVRAMVGVHHRLRIHAQAYMVEADGFDQGDVTSGGPVLKMLFCVSLRIVNLSEPLTSVDAATDVSQSRGGNGRKRGRRGLRAGGDFEKKKKQKAGRLAAQ